MAHDEPPTKPRWCPAWLWRIREASRGTAQWGPRRGTPEDDVSTFDVVETGAHLGPLGALYAATIGLLFNAKTEAEGEADRHDADWDSSDAPERGDWDEWKAP